MTTINLNKLEDVAHEWMYGPDVIATALDLLAEARASNDDYWDTSGEWALLIYCDEMLRGV